MRKILLASTLIIPISLYFLSASLLRAQENQAPKGGIAVSPPTFEISGNPGDSVTNTVRVENINDYPVRLAVDRRNFTAIGEEGAVGITEEETSFSLASWIAVTPGEITIPPKSTHTFNFTIKVPLSAEPGGHFGSLVFRTVPSENLQESGAALATEIGSLVLLKIAGDTTEEAKIESFGPENNFFEYGPVPLHARVANTGNVHVKPTGTITITNMFGQKVANFPLESKNILPGAIRKLSSSWDTKWRLGRYTATVVMVYGKDYTQRASVTNFIVLPYRVLAVCIVLVATLSFLLYRSRKRLALALKIILTGKS